MAPGADELASRPAKKTDYARENQSLLRLARAQTGSREDLLNAIAREALALCCAGSAGISLVEGVADSRCFRWLEVAGLCSGLHPGHVAFADTANAAASGAWRIHRQR
ncbi:hypothetical protein [Paraburkholderia sp. UYCP14C]|uniref:hypothetical protein n=1 Tax=Paraburkholderia sp. UYCP14C TaxID=2511130 RepID=UPI0020070C2D|nr:hypothetical protein [Paraburkholderia sp. UYCP14C]